MKPTMWYDKKGRPIEDYDIIEIHLRDPNYKIVAKDRIGTTKISTVWLGLDHRHGEGKPLIFETMIFENVDIGGTEQRRYCTERQALLGHTKWVFKVIYRKMTVADKIVAGVMFGALLWGLFISNSAWYFLAGLILGEIFVKKKLKK